VRNYRTDRKTWEETARPAAPVVTQPNRDSRPTVGTGRPRSRLADKVGQQRTEAVKVRIPPPPITARAGKAPAAPAAERRPSRHRIPSPKPTGHDSRDPRI